MITRGVAVAIGLTVVSILACFRPDVASGGYTCAEGGICPEGLECSAVDHRCYKKDAGPEACGLPVTVPLCTAQPAANDACNPTCQTGCACGRCTLVGGVATCLAPGSKKAGELCNPTVDECEAGLGCVRDECGVNLGRCVRFCTDNGDCPEGLACAVTLDRFRACGAPPVNCNALDGSGCSSSALACYYQASRGTTFCECAGQQEEADTCVFYADCTPGYTCVDITGVRTCRRLCTVAGNDCTAPQTCRPLGGSSFGFCR